MSGFLSYDLAKAFAFSRNDSLNFAYLKENAELLCIARAQRFLLEPRARELYASFYNKASLLVGLYPQYYRFLLGIVLDLEDLGMPGNVGEEICQYIRSKNLLAFDTSDIRRLEAVHLLGRGADLTEKEIVIKRTLKG